MTIPKARDEMSAVILAGGQSRRIGTDKAFIEIEGVSIIRRQVKILRGIFPGIIIVTNNPQKHKLRSVKIVQDVIPGCGPLGGIYSGLKASGSFYNFVVACDMPFINAELIRYMACLKDGFDAVVPRRRKGYEALFAIYSKNCIKPISEALEADNFQVRQFFSKIRLRDVGEEEIKKYGPAHILFMNINRPADLCRITTYLKR